MVVLLCACLHQMRASACVHAMCYGRRQLCLSRHTQFNCVCHTQFNCVCHDTLVTTHTPVLSRLLQHARERERDGLGRRRWHSGLACRISLSFERCRSCIEKSPQKNTRKPRPTEAYTNTRITYRFQYWASSPHLVGLVCHMFRWWANPCPRSTHVVSLTVGEHETCVKKTCVKHARAFWG